MASNATHAFARTDRTAIGLWWWTTDRWLLGATALLVTHDQQEAFAIGDQIGVMSQGQLHQWDDAYTLYHRPASRFVSSSRAAFRRSGSVISS